MQTMTLKAEIHEYIEKADERFLSLVYAMIKADQPEQSYPLTQEEINLLEERLADHEKYPNTGSSWEEVMSRLGKK